MDKQWLSTVSESISINRHSISWFDEIIIKRKNLLSDNYEVNDQKELVTIITELLYNYFYSVGEPILGGTFNNRTINTINKDISEVLNSNNVGTGRIEPNWIYTGKNHLIPEYINVLKSGFQISIPLNLVHVTGNTKPILGTSIKVKMPSASFGISNGFYVAHSNAPFSHLLPMSRIYININYNYAPLLMKVLTTKLNDGNISFDFKVCKNLKDFYRCDVSVLYIYKKDFPIVIELLVTDIRDFIRKKHIRVKTPSLTYRLLDGIGVADNPDNGESFGIHRCTIIATGIIASIGISKKTEKISIIQDSFKKCKMNINKPYLNSASIDIYEKKIE